jgi:cellulose synthase/poly-beta-1,6-N-acetylglucosamine synthase-like glycosyltransferase
MCRLIINKVRREERNNSFVKQCKDLIDRLNGKMGNIKAKHLFDSYTELIQSVELKGFKDFEELDVIRQEQVLKKHINNLKAWSKIKRIRAAETLGIIKGVTARKALEKALRSEKDYSVKLYIANALSDIGKKSSLPALIESLIDSHRWYKEKVNSLICDFGEDLHSYLPDIESREEIEIKELIVYFSTIYISSYMKSYLLKLIDHRELELERLKILYEDKHESCCSNCIYGKTQLKDGTRLCKYKGAVDEDYLCSRYKKLPVSNQSILNYKKLIYKAAEVLSEFYQKELSAEKFLKDEDPELRSIAMKALASSNEMPNLIKLIDSLEDDSTARVAIYSISKIIENNPSFIREVARRFRIEKNYIKKQRLADVLSSRVEYFILKLNSEESGNSSEIIKQIILLGKTSEIIGFINKNRDIEIENALVEIIRFVVKQKEELKNELGTYLNERLLKKCRLEKQEIEAKRREEKKDVKLIRKLYILLAASILIFPAVYVIRYYEDLLSKPWAEQLSTYVIDFNYYLAYYSVAINAIYLILLVLSYINSEKQSKLWDLKSMSFLFKKKILPAISIIAPAYNEEKTIIESTNSLLNLKYPDYELILVNDGSKDNTLNTLIQQFNLIRVDYMFEYKIKTMPVRGIYRNPSIPKLLVVDKENGGKADSLNAGINISNKEYFCGIDADSLLEEESLLKLASLTLDEHVETPALGGNIFPINGCTVESGMITDIKIPENKVARLQTIEYIRAFMAGRLGWAYTNSLLIISGAFGLFRKERIIGIGGYLTSSGKYAKDTVGEDMELVVRISRLMRESGLKYKICYAFNANCWTEVPEDLKSLKRQRYRWHRGLIDILTYHKKVLFNPSYGRMGLVAMPYFFIFEMMGPIIELQGYIMVVLAFFLGLLNIKLAAILFLSTVLMGTLISILSLLIAEKDLDYFSYKDIFIMVLYAIAENFGPRQFFSFWRVGGYFNMLKKPQGWGKLERKGFAANKGGVAG